MNVDTLDIMGYIIVVVRNDIGLWGNGKNHYTTKVQIVEHVCRPLVLDTVSVSDTFKMYLYRHIDTFFMENVSVYQYILCCRYFF